MVKWKNGTLDPQILQRTLLYKKILHVVLPPTVPILGLNGARQYFLCPGAVEGDHIRCPARWACFVTGGMAPDGIDQAGDDEAEPEDDFYKDRPFSFKFRLSLCTAI